MTYFEKQADVQMLAMLSCILIEFDEDCPVTALHYGPGQLRLANSPSTIYAQSSRGIEVSLQRNRQILSPAYNLDSQARM